MAFAPQHNSPRPRVTPIRGPQSQPYRKREYVAIVLFLGLGICAWLRVFAQVRLTDLQWESRRIERLNCAANMRRQQLIRQREQLLTEERLANIAAAHRMQPPVYVRKLYFGALPPPKIYWDLPEEPQKLEELPEPLLGWRPAQSKGPFYP